MNQEERIKVRARIIESGDNWVKVQVNKQTECGKCNSCHGKDDEFKVETAKHFNNDDEVYLTVSCALIRKISFLLFFIPAFSALLGFIIGYRYFGDLGGFICSLTAVSLVFLSVKIFSNKKYKSIIEINNLI